MVRACVAAAFASASVLDVPAWARANFRVEPGGSSPVQPGTARRARRLGPRIDLNITPYLIEPARLLTDPTIREITFMSGSQLGKTILLFVGLTYFTAQLGLDGLLVYQTEPQCMEMMADRLLPSIAAVAPAARMVGSTIELGPGRAKIYGGWAESPRSVRSRSVPFVGCDESSSWKNQGVFDDLRARGRQKPGSKLLDVSTPTYARENIDARFAMGDRRAFHVPCPRCAQYFYLEFRSLRWGEEVGEDGERSKGNARSFGGLDVPPAVAARTVRAVCPACHGAIDHAHKPWMIRHGLWIAPHLGERILSEGPILDTMPGGALDPMREEKSTKRKAQSAHQEPSELDRVAEGGLAWLDGPRLRVAGGVGGGAAGGGDETEEVRAAARLGVRVESRPELSDGTVRDPSHASRRISTLCAIAQPWGKLAARWVADRGRPGMAWINNELGETWEPSGRRADERRLIPMCERSGYVLGMAPSWAIWLTLEADIQMDYAVLVVRAWGERAERSAVVWCERRPCPAFARVPLGELDDVFQWAFRVEEAEGGGGGGESGPRTLPVLGWIFDQGARSTEVIRLCMRGRDILARRGVPSIRGGWIYTAKGASHEQVGDVVARVQTTTAQGQRIPGGMEMLLIDTVAVKDQVMAAMLASSLREDEMGRLVPPAGPLPLELPRDLMEKAPWYVEQLCSEQRVMTRRRGGGGRGGGGAGAGGRRRAEEEGADGDELKPAWVAVPGRQGNNHAFDAAVYGFALRKRLELRHMTAAVARKWQGAAGSESPGGGQSTKPKAQSTHGGAGAAGLAAKLTGVNLMRKSRG